MKGGNYMIKSEQQKNRTIKILKELQEKKNTAHKDAIGSIESLIGQLEAELNEYKKLKNGEFVLPKNITFVELLKNIAKIRISKGLSQQDLANLLGVSKQQINRYEEHDYQNISIIKINEILSALDLSISLEAAKKMAA